MACLTNKPQAFATPLLASKGLAGFFSGVYGGDAFERKKPDPLPLVKTCEAMGSAPHRTLMVGDSSNDAQAARAAGCPVVLMTYGYNHGESVDADGPIEQDKGEEEIRKEPLPLPKEYEWCLVDVTVEEEVRARVITSLTRK